MPFPCLPEASLSKGGVARRGEAADGDNRQRGTGTGEESDCTHLSTAAMREQQQHWEVAELKPAIVKMVPPAEDEAGVWLQDSAGKQATFENSKESSIASSSALFFHLRLSVH